VPYNIEVKQTHMQIPTYDFPHSPILWLGFLGIAVALVTVYTVNKAYFNSPFNK